MKKITVEEAAKNSFNENDYNIGNLTILRDKLIEHQDELNFTMDVYIDEEFEYEGVNVNCNTAGCILGHSPQWFEVAADEIHSDNGIIYNEYSERLFYKLAFNKLWDFIFGPYWPNNIKEAIGRINYIIEQGDCPEGWSYKDSFMEYYHAGK